VFSDWAEILAKRYFGTLRTYFSKIIFLPFHLARAEYCARYKICRLPGHTNCTEGTKFVPKAGLCLEHVIPGTKLVLFRAFSPIKNTYKITILIQPKIVVWGIRIMTVGMCTVKV
jgi:hypothetical protein